MMLYIVHRTEKQLKFGKNRTRIDKDTTITSQNTTMMTSRSFFNVNRIEETVIIILFFQN